MIRDVIDRFRYRFELWWREQRDDWIGPPGTHLPDVHDYASPKLLSMLDDPKYEVLLTESTRCFAKMKTLQTILPLTMMFIMAVTGFETKASRSENEITIDYPSLTDTTGRFHHVQLVLRPDGSVMWRDLTTHVGR